MKRRGSGVLLHVSSLPSPFGIGDMGPSAYQFVDFLAGAKQSYWQILPLNPTDTFHYNSPYHTTGAFAGNPLLISPELLAEQGFLDKKDLSPSPEFSHGRVDFRSVTAYKEKIFMQAYERFKTTKEKCDYESFCSQNSDWLEDFALFMALRSRFKKQAWSEWPQDIRDRKPDVLQSVRKELGDSIEMQKFLQFVSFMQWLSLKSYCNGKGVQIIGDIPIYVDYDSADVWTYPHLFKLDDKKRPYVVAGVPPDYFSKTGQLWGNPIYHWDVMKQNGYDWWVRRMAHSAKLFDFMRVDHFRGFVAYWEVPAHEKNAVNGRWVEAPALDFFNHLTKKFPYLPIIAEDLGVITADVREIMRQFRFPGMKLLLFAFGSDMPTNPYIPHNLVKNCVAYTGTHDNITVRGWFEKVATREEKERVFRYLGHEVTAEQLPWELVRLVMMSIANTVILPMQDLLCLSEEARMNQPATQEGNWQWRLSPDLLTPALTARLLEMTETYGRT